MPTISKFYLHDATSPNTGTMPSNSPAVSLGGATTDAAGSTVARDTSGVIGTLQASGTQTSLANQTGQRGGLRRFVSRPLAAHSFANADGTWTFSYARSESNTLHNGQIECVVYAWRPSTGLVLGDFAHSVFFTGTAMSSTSEVADSVTGTWNASNPQSIIDGDILVFDVTDIFTQGMSTAYTSSFFYDGTTEASATTCASFITPPAALTLFASSSNTSGFFPFIA